MATRLNNNLPTLYQEFIHLSRYSRWLEDKGRRETWGETIDRYFNFFEINKRIENIKNPPFRRVLINYF